VVFSENFEGKIVYLGVNVIKLFFLRHSISGIKKYSVCPRHIFRQA
jgi:hypothetical protein